jgi:DNA-binding FadR family transcriptional regulator
LDTINEKLEVREGLQGIAARGCAARAGEQGGEALREWLLKGAAAERDGDVDAFAAADGGFHFAIGERCGNRMLGEMVSYVEEIYRMSNRVLVDLGHRVEVSQREHQRVVECIVAGDGDGAESAMRDHIRGVRAAMAPLVSEQVET